MSTVKNKLTIEQLKAGIEQLTEGELETLELMLTGEDKVLLKAYEDSKAGKGKRHTREALEKELGL